MRLNMKKTLITASVVTLGALVFAIVSIAIQNQTGFDISWIFRLLLYYTDRYWGAIVVFVGICCWIGGTLRKGNFRKIEAIADPNDRIEAIQQFMKKNAQFRKVDSDLGKSKAALKCSLLNMTAQAYIQLGSYGDAMSTLEDAANVLPLLMDYAASGTSHPRVIYELAVIECLAHMERMDEAERMLAPHINAMNGPNAKIVYPTALDRCVISCAEFSLAVQRSDKTRARDLLEDLTPEIKLIIRKLKGAAAENAKMDLLLMNAYVEVLENRPIPAIEKLDTIISECTHFGNVREAKELRERARAMSRTTTS